MKTLTTDQKVTGLNPVGVTTKSGGCGENRNPFNFLGYTISTQLA